MTNKELISEIVQGILDFRIIPFFGAGMSKPLGLKDWDELIEEMRNELNSKETNNLKVAQLYENSFGRSRLISKLKESYTIGDLSNANTSNHQLILAMAPPIIYTTNYDEAIEKSAELIRHDYYKIACLKDIVQMPHSANVLVKFHGDFSAESEIVLTENDYEKRMAVENPLDIIFRSHLLGKSIFFMGYGLRDKNIDFIFHKHSSQYGKENLPPSYIVVFKDDHSFEKQEEFKKKNIRTILLESPEELNELLNKVNEEVFNGHFNKQTEKIFQSVPQQVLLEKELENLITFWESDRAPIEKAEKIEETLSMKIIPDQLQQKVATLFKTIFENQSFPNEGIDIIMRTLDWSQVKPATFFEVGVALTALTERPYYQRSLSNFKLLDPLQTLEKVFHDKGATLCIFSYLCDCYHKKKKLSQSQLQDLCYVLQACDHESYEFGEILSKDIRKQILDHFYGQHPGWKPISGIIKPRSLNSIYENLIKMMPDKFNEI